jgi:hypothetical protein
MASKSFASKKFHIVAVILTRLARRGYGQPVASCYRLAPNHGMGVMLFLHGVTGGGGIEIERLV